MTASSSANRGGFQTRLRALLLEGLKLIGIALACLVILTIIVVLSVKTGITVPKRWVGLVGWTGVLVWVIFRQYKTSLRHARFWFAFSPLLLVHLTAFVVVLERYPEWGINWFMPFVIVEAPIMAMAIETALPRNHSRTIHQQFTELMLRCGFTLTDSTDSMEHNKYSDL